MEIRTICQCLQVKSKDSAVCAPEDRRRQLIIRRNISIIVPHIEASVLKQAPNRMTSSSSDIGDPAEV
jgi:hypothetical protein